jgi:hypothetical protein
MKLNRFSKRFNTFSKTKLNVRLTSTTFYEDEDGDEIRKKIFNYNYDYYSDSDYYFDSNFNNRFLEEKIDNDKIDNDKIDNDKIDNDKLDNEILYTLIWFDCEDCRKLLIDVKNDNKKILYIDGGYYFFDENDETNTPIFYKNDELIATDVFSIYEELFFDKIIE